MPKKPKTKVLVTLDNDVLEKVDIKRGLVERSPYINQILKKHIEENE